MADFESPDVPRGETPASPGWETLPGLLQNQLRSWSETLKTLEPEIAPETGVPWIVMQLESLTPLVSVLMKYPRIRGYYPHLGHWQIMFLRPGEEWDRHKWSYHCRALRPGWFRVDRSKDGKCEQIAEGNAEHVAEALARTLPPLTAPDAE